MGLKETLILRVIGIIAMLQAGHVCLDGALLRDQTKKTFTV